MKDMSGATLPKDHWEKSVDDLNCADLKYGSDFGNPDELKSNAESLASYVKKNKNNR